MKPTASHLKIVAGIAALAYAARMLPVFVLAGLLLILSGIPRAKK